MIIEIADHHTANVGGAMVARAVHVINTYHMVPAYLHQFAELWDKGLRYDFDDDFWTACKRDGANIETMKKANVL